MILDLRYLFTIARTRPRHHLQWSYVFPSTVSHSKYCDNTMMYLTLSAFLNQDLCRVFLILRRQSVIPSRPVKATIY